YETDEGSVRVIDFMPPRDRAPDIVRIVEGLTGRVPMRMELVIRFGYGNVVPWVHRLIGTRVAVAGPDHLTLRTPVAVQGENLPTGAEFKGDPGQRIPFALPGFSSHESLPRPIDAEAALADTESYWREWAAASEYRGDFEDEIHHSLLVLKALTYEPTG